MDFSRNEAGVVAIVALAIVGTLFHFRPRKHSSAAPPSSSPSSAINRQNEASVRPRAAHAAWSEDTDSTVRNSLAQINDRGLQTYWLGRLVAEHAECDPADAAHWLLRLPDTLDRRAAFTQVCQRWAEAEPQRAAEFAWRLPSGELRHAAIVAVLSVWITRNVSAATTWLNQLDANRDLDGAAALIASMPALVETRPDVALGWAESITDAHERRQHIATILNSWMAHDRTAAIAYLDSTTRLNAFENRTLREELGIDDNG